VKVASKHNATGGNPARAGDGQADLHQAAQVIRRGGVVAFPTESFYGLAVDITDPRAIQRLFEIKERSPGQPILLLLPSLSDLERYAAAIPPPARRLIARFWPGGLTLIFKATNQVSPLLTAQSGTIGLRLSSHPLATGLARAVAGAITGTSANLSGQPACQNAQAVRDALGARLDFVLDGGSTPGGLGSTILDMTVDPPLLVRAGQIGRSEIEPVCALK
jgi:L-threonylcarbamoyladenylate synthase